MVFDRQADTTFFGDLHGIGEHPGEPFKLRLMWLVAKPEAAANPAHHVRPDCPGTLDTRTHVLVSVFVQSTFEPVRMSPRVHPIEPEPIQEPLDAGQVT